MSEKLRTKTSKIWEFIFWNTSIHIWVFIKIFCVISVCLMCAFLWCMCICVRACVFMTLHFEHFLPWARISYLLLCIPGYLRAIGKMCVSLPSNHSCSGSLHLALCRFSESELMSSGLCSKRFIQQLLHSSLYFRIRDAQPVLYSSTGLFVRALCCVDKHSNRKCL